MDCFLKFENMKLELLVIVDQYAPLNRIISLYTPPVKISELVNYKWQL